MTKPERIAWLKTCTASHRREYYKAIKNLPCIVTGKWPTVAHHCFGYAFPATRDHRPCIPLHETMHKEGEPDGIHERKRSWERDFGTQEELLIKTEELLEASWKNQ